MFSIYPASFVTVYKFFTVGARNILRLENIMKCMFENLRRPGPPAALPPAYMVYRKIYTIQPWPREFAPVSDIMFHYSLRAATAGQAVLGSQTFQGRASNELVHFQGLEYFSLQRSRPSIKVAGRACSIILRSTFAIGVSFTINDVASQPVSTQGYTTYEIVDYFNVVVLWSIEVIQVWV